RTRPRRDPRLRPPDGAPQRRPRTRPRLDRGLHRPRRLRHMARRLLRRERPPLRSLGHPRRCPAPAQTLPRPRRPRFHFRSPPPANRARIGRVARHARPSPIGKPMTEAPVTQDVTASTRATLDHFYAAYTGGDLEGMLAMMTDDVVVTFIGHGTFHG